MKCAACNTPYVDGKQICMCTTGGLNTQETNLRAVLLAQNFALVEMIDKELQLGTKHYSKKGKLLPDLQSIIDALKKDEFGTAEPTKEREQVFYEMQDVEPDEDYKKAIKERNEIDSKRN